MNLTNCIHIQDDPKKSSDYYIMYNPSTVNLMEKIGASHFTVPDVVEYLTGKN